MSAIHLSDPVINIPKIGSKYQRLLEILEIFTVEDLLYHFPFRYEDFTQVKSIKDLQEGDFCTVRGVLGPVDNITTRYRKRLTKAKVVDFTGELDIVWFNQHWLKKSLITGKTYNLSGKVGTFNKKPTLVSPEIEINDEKSLNTCRLVPIYPETAGVSSKWLRTRINDVLDSKSELQLDFSEFLPQKILDERGYNNYEWSLNQIHFPDSVVTAEKAKLRFQFEELFTELINVEKRKKEWHVTLAGHSLKPFKNKTDKFVEDLPFKLTKSQKEAVEDILTDMQKSHPMNRILEGDVGTGKTIVAVVAAFLTHLNGLKTLYMAPTEILAKQHFETFKKLLDGSGVRVSLKTSTRKKAGENWDILIGTHALLFNENYDDIGLVVIDEQHRFGVEQRGQIIEMGKKDNVPHLLTMTATPIPRTLALTLYGDLDISALKEFPVKPRNVVTKVVAESQRNDAYEWIKKKKEQAFIVCPLIEESESNSLENVKAAEAEYESLKKGVFSDLRVGLLHGRMKSKEKEEVVEKYRLGKLDVLVSTPVIEVGIDIPEATVMVIESGERYGLASLHQLRGRVGRGDKDGYCFVFMSNYSKKAYARLKNLEEIHNGLELAEIDMKFRGQGDIFGTMQHGFKRFKIATLSDVEMLERAKLAVQEIFPEIEKYPKLIERLEDRMGRYVGSN